ncbi:MAG: hypothetical protein CFH16_00698 [Alphaproteobacteria bacterium MarineAlpha5_Bin6]|nr:MAG: hypothetical protein CFH17_00252 [Alphaproteobacteria bacterium MarineAlpha5_Bin7]PPR54004.1 MAG: hypothetical protein CFH16_00698 [Alphaproteobacteria bacterium MarineAlpha5_Bin6]
MNNFFNINKFNSFIVFLLPISLISGPAIPDMIVSLSSFLFLFKLLIEKNFKPLNVGLIIFFFILCLYFFVRSIFTYEYMYSFEYSLFFFRFGFFSLLILYLIKTEKYFLKNFSIVILLCLLIVSLDAIFQFSFGFNFLGFTMSEDLSGRGRISGLFGSENILGSYLSRLLPISLGLMIYNFYFLKNFNFLLVFFIVVTNTAIFLSGERSAFFYCLLTNITILFFANKYNFQFLISIIISSIIILFILFYNDHLKYRYITYTQQQFTSTVLDESEIIDLEKKGVIIPTNLFIFSKEHQQLFAQALKIFSKNILFGVGPKIYRIECQNPIYRTKISRVGPTFEEFLAKKRGAIWEPHDKVLSGCSTHPHNMYLQLLSETGIIGTLPIFIFFIYILNIFRVILFEKIHKIKKNNILEIDVFIYLSILIAIWPIIPTGNFFNNWLNVINFLCLGFFLYANEYRKRKIID